jgi:hypothetical protein
LSNKIRILSSLMCFSVSPACLTNLSSSVLRLKVTGSQAGPFSLLSSPWPASRTRRHTTHSKSYPAQTTVKQTSNVKNGRTNVPNRFGNETETFWYRSRISLIKNKLFRFYPESALQDQTKGSPSMGQIRERTQSFLVSILLDIGTFVERLWNVCSFTVLTLLKTRVLNPQESICILLNPIQCSIFISGSGSTFRIPDPGVKCCAQ